MTRVLRLSVRSPRGLHLDAEVDAITAEDSSGWVGVLPGRQDFVAVLPPGLLLFRDSDGEGYVAVAGGLLELRQGVCRVLAREAVVDRDLDAISARVGEMRSGVRDRGDRRRRMVDDLAREALRRLELEVRT